MKNFVLAGVSSLAIAAAASAAFTGFQSTTSIVNFGSVDYAVINVYAGFDVNTAKVVNVFNATISSTCTFVHQGGDTNWSPKPGDMGGAANAVADSFVTIGGNQAQGGNPNLASNSTSADPNWGDDGFFQAGIPALAGWFNGNPPNNQGQALAVGGLAGFNTFVGRFVCVAKKILKTTTVDGQGNILSVEFSDTADTLSFKANVTATPTGNNGQSIKIFDYAFILNEQTVVIPAPGALALLGLAGLAGGRRRRA